MEVGVHKLEVHGNACRSVGVNVLKEAAAIFEIRGILWRTVRLSTISGVSRGGLRSYKPTPPTKYL